MTKILKLNDNEICLVIGALGFVNQNDEDKQLKNLKDKIGKQYIEELKKEYRNKSKEGKKL